MCDSTGVMAEWLPRQLSGKDRIEYLKVAFATLLTALQLWLTTVQRLVLITTSWFLRNKFAAGEIVCGVNILLPHLGQF